MKLTSFFTLFVCLVAVCSAAPIDKGKGKEREITPPPSRPHTPTHADHPDVPLPGRNGVYTDNGVTTAFYGDDKLPEHMGHLQRNQAEYPINRQPMPLAGYVEHTRNRKNALAGVPSGGKYRNTDIKAYRDEKPLAMLSNEHHASTTTVEKLPAGESNIEGGLASLLKKQMQAHGSKGQIRDNPGWKTLDPKQRIAHEAPARLNSQRDKFDVDPAVAYAAKKKAEAEKSLVPPRPPRPPKRPIRVSAPSLKKKLKASDTGRKPGRVARERIKKTKSGIPRSPKQNASIERVKKAKASRSNLRPGRVSAPGHLWHPNKHGPSHAGAPIPVTNSATRQPPRPQDDKDYVRQQEQQQEAHAARFRDNLAKFNAVHPPIAPAHGAHHAEAPARLQHPPPDKAAHTAGTHPPAHATGSHPPAHHAALPHHPAPPPKSGAKKSGKK